MLFRALGFKPKSSLNALRTKLPVLHAFVDITVSKGASTQVSVDAITSKTISTPAFPGLSVGAVVVFVYTNPHGKYRFATKCTSIKAAEAHFALPVKIEPLQKFGGAQKRNTVRLDTTLPAQWRYTTQGKGTGEFTRGSLTDISRTGASLIADRDLSKGTQVEVRFSLNSVAAPVELLGEVMRASKIEKSGKNSLGLRFVGVSSADDRAIMEFINNRQAERRSRGLA
jgi:c-di-GMP-binding flagellar brake protein YcgR